MSVASRREELLSKTIHEVQADTAVAWAERSIAAYDLFMEVRDLRWLRDADDYLHEAIEHLALVEGTGVGQEQLARDRVRVAKVSRQACWSVAGIH